MVNPRWRLPTSKTGDRLQSRLLPAQVLPLSRNAVEVSLPFDERIAKPDLLSNDYGQICYCANATAGTRVSEDTVGCDNAQACFWFSQGCSIGCSECDGVNGRKQIDLCGEALA